MLVTCVVAVATPALAQQQGQLFAAQQDGFGRLILSFPALDKFPTYTMRLENGVLSLNFDQPVDVVLPDVGKTMPDYLSVARLDADGKGLRIGLKRAFNFNRTDAGKQLFIDLMPPSWQGMPPALPQDIIDQLAEKARQDAIQAERERKAKMAAELQPQVDLRVGRNPTFLRMQFDWNVPTSAEFHQKGALGALTFEWPVTIDFGALSADLPHEIASVQSGSSPDGAAASFVFADGVTPRFYQTSPTQYVLDVDLAGHALPELKAEDLEADAAKSAAAAEAAKKAEEPKTASLQQGAATTIRPFINVLGSTVRVVFPFEQDTPAAVFRRGDTVWLMFDTASGIDQPAKSPDFDALAKEFAIIPSSDTQVIRLDLSQDRLATLGSEGMAWVLSLGDMMLNPTEPMSLTRQRNVDGAFQMVANLDRPGRLHDFRDPLVGDTLKIVTAYPPARGMTRGLDYVDFTALKSIHGLVLKPKSPDLDVALDGKDAIIGTHDGLTVSALDSLRNISADSAPPPRLDYINLSELEQREIKNFVTQRDTLEAKAAAADGKDRDTARLGLAQYYVANQFGFEALGVLKVMQQDLKSDDLTRKIRTTEAVANVLAGRPRDALRTLNSSALDQEADALFWRTIARTQTYDFKGAVSDATAARDVVQSYPIWARNAFHLSAARAAIEGGDAGLAQRMLDDTDFAGLEVEDASTYQLIAARIAEAKGLDQEALDTYGQVIASEVRPTRAEAVYRTLQLLDKAGHLDLPKAIQTLGAEAMMWRGDPLEAEMQTLLAQLYFRNKDYRLGFETVKAAVSNFPESPPVNTLRDQAQSMFTDLFLNGVADSIGPVDALSIYYDFRQLTPPGAKGDEMIRNLARRLVRVDLLPQASELLQYQLDNRLRGAARTQIAADLAVIYLADRKPQDAMRVLNNTQLPGIPESLARQRKILEARAMIDSGRDQLATDLIRDMSGKDVDLLRIDANWKAKRYTQAGEMLEGFYTSAPDGKPLERSARMDLVKAAVGYVLANDAMGVSRLRAKFGDRMVNSPEWPMFDYVTGPIETSSLEFKKVAAQVADVDGLGSFLSAYRDAYASEGALSPDKAADTSAGLASR